jgi:hypothetical protein
MLRTFLSAAHTLRISVIVQYLEATDGMTIVRAKPKHLAAELSLLLPCQMNFMLF